MIELLRVVKDELNEEPYKLREQLVKARLEICPQKETVGEGACPVLQGAECSEGRNLIS